MSKLSEQFVYPRNKQQKTSYLALLRMMHEKRRIQYTLTEALDAVLTSLSMYDDTRETDEGPQSGPNAKKAQKILRSLAVFVRPTSPGVFEICVYDKTGTRITNFQEFYTLCRTDLRMSSQEPNHDNLVYRPWTDAEHAEPSTQSISSMQQEIDRVNSATISTDDSAQRSTMTSLPHPNKQLREQHEDVEYMSALSVESEG